jgi:serine/threonine protein kinase
MEPITLQQPRLTASLPSERIPSTPRGVPSTPISVPREKVFESGENPTGSFPYIVEAKIGEGAMGAVYRATEPELNRVVAIKALRVELLKNQEAKLADEARSRFLQEARAAAALAHTGVTTIYRVGQHQGTPFIAMEWLDGRPLDQVVRDNGPLDPRQGASLGVELLETLAVAHQAGVIHRDIKPSNLMLLSNGKLKVTDFGIARVRGSELIETQAGLVLATPKFASPEQLRAEDVDGRCDLFSTGVVLYYLLTGKYPFDGENFMEVTNAILRLEPPPIREFIPALPTAMAAAITRALKKNREDRYATALEMANALRPFTVEGSPSTASGSYRTGLAATDTARIEIEEGSPSFTELPKAPEEMLVALVRTWPSRDLGAQNTAQLLSRLQEQPLHAPPFAGAVFIGSACLLLESGLILGAIDLASAGEVTGDVVVESLAEKAEAKIHSLPEGTHPCVIRSLCSLLYPPKIKHQDLDSSFVHLPALAEKLHQEKFNGILRLQRGDGLGFLVLAQGDLCVTLFSKGWKDVDVQRPWQSWVSEVSVRASVEEAHLVPSIASLRHHLASLFIGVDQITLDGSMRDKPVDKTSTVLRLLKDTGSATLQADIAFRLKPDLAALGSPDDNAVELHLRDPAFRFLEYALESLPEFFRERDKVNRWKYLLIWLFLVRKAVLHHDLERPQEGKSDFFDLVTLDAQDKVLHVGQWQARVTRESFEAFRQNVVDAKSARTKTGDIGGAFLISPQITPEARAAYVEATKPEKASGWFGVEESFTGYEGFVRIGARRGFHLLMLEETPDGFQPILPV